MAAEYVARIFSGPPARSMRPMLDMGFNVQVEKRVDLVFFEDGHGGSANLYPRLQMTPVEFGEQLTQSLSGRVQSLLTAVTISFALLTGREPVDGVSVVGLIVTSKQGKRLGLGLVRGFGAAPDDALGNGAIPKRLFERTHFRPVLRQNGNGTSLMADDMCQLLLSTEFTIGHIQEVRRTVDLAQPIPCLYMSCIIVAIAWVDMVIDWYCAIVGNTQLED